MEDIKTKFLSIRTTPGFVDFLEVIAGEFGVTKSRYARWIIEQELKRQKARYHVLGWDRPRTPKPQIADQCSIHPA